VAAVTCAEIRELFSTRVDEALTPDERARFDVHLADCADCGREWQRFEATVGLLRAAEPVRAPAGFVDRVLAARPQPWYRRLARAVFSPWPVKLPLEAAALVLVAGLAVVIFQRSPEFQQLAPGPAAPPPVIAPEPAARSNEPPATADDRSGDVAPAPFERRLEDAPAQHGSSPPRAADSGAAEPPPVAVAPRSVEPEPGPDSRAELRAKETTPTAPGRQAERDARQSAPTTAAAPPAGQKAAKAEGLASRREARAFPADVEARLAAPDRATAERDLAALVTRLGGVVTSSSPEVVDVVVSRAAWEQLTRELARLGALQVDRRPAELPATVRLTVRLTD
jgi:hypothetical protein